MRLKNTYMSVSCSIYLLTSPECKTYDPMTVSHFVCFLSYQLSYVVFSNKINNRVFFFKYDSKQKVKYKTNPMIFFRIFICNIYSKNLDYSRKCHYFFFLRK